MRGSPCSSAAGCAGGSTGRWKVRAARTSSSVAACAILPARASTRSFREVVSPAMEPRKTPLWDVHRQLGAKLVDFAGWHMPVSYPAGTIKEHKAVREALGLFDVSHMGEAYLRGPRAAEAVARLATNDVAGAPVGKAVYTLLCRPDGGIVDDCIFYKRADDHYFVIVNASNKD